MKQNFIHTKARNEKHPVYPERFYVSDDNVAWITPFPLYRPSYFVDGEVLANDETLPASHVENERWAEAEDFELIKRSKKFESYVGNINFDKKGYPLNPIGRTGLRGRGKLGKWGTNFAADPVVTRKNEVTGFIEMLAIKRKDTGEWAIPGGMVDKGEMLSETLKREFGEETGIVLNMADAIEIYRGYVDDPRNTDNAWVETIASHKHVPWEIAQKMIPKAGSDAQKAKWLPLSENIVNHLYASHKEFVLRAISLIK